MAGLKRKHDDTGAADPLADEFSVWLRNNGVHTNTKVLELAPSPTCGGLGFVAKRDVRKGEVLVSMKQRLLLSVPTALASEVGSAVYGLLDGSEDGTGRGGGGNGGGQGGGGGGGGGGNGGGGAGESSMPGRSGLVHLSKLSLNQAKTHLPTPSSLAHRPLLFHGRAA